MFTVEFLQRAAERAVKTAAQVAVLVLVGSEIPANGFDVVNADWAVVGSYAAGGAVLSVLTSVIGSSWGDRTDPSWVDPQPTVL